MSEEKDFPRIAMERLGVDPDKLGCVMLGIELPEKYRSVLKPEWEYVSDDPSLKHVKGYNVKPHVTLLYGLLLSAQTHRDLVDGVLMGWHQPSVVLLEDVKVFGPDPDYSAIVLTNYDDHLWAKEDLEDANARLSKLPHVRSFYEFKPHVTVGYVKKEFSDLAREAVDGVEPRPLRTTVLDYGD